MLGFYGFLSNLSTLTLKSPNRIKVLPSGLTLSTLVPSLETKSGIFYGGVFKNLNNYIFKRASSKFPKSGLKYFGGV